MKYEIDFDAIKKDYIKNGKFVHDPKKKYLLMPYNTQYKEKHKSEVESFDEVVGEFSRCITNKKCPKQVLINEYKEAIINSIRMDKKNRAVMNDLITKLFFKNDRLSNFHPKTLNYNIPIQSNKKLGKFLFDVLFDENEFTKKLIDKAYNDESENILLKLMVKNLPELSEVGEKKQEYKGGVPYIKQVFMEDFNFLINDAEQYSKNIEKLLKLYYMIYVSQESMVLRQGFEAELDEPIEIYYALDWENVSKGRACLNLGWKKVESNVLTLFSHANTLDLINHNKEGREYSYVEFKQRFSEMSLDEKEDFVSDMTKLIELYKESLPDGKWEEFEYRSKSDNKEEDIIYNLFGAVYHQFERSGRKERQRDYGTWFVEFCKSNFLRTRGRYGLVFNLREEYIILLTKLIIKDEEKIKINTLFEELRRRGIMLDKESQSKLTELYEKLNILEKKSDSGDAQYVKRIL